MRLIVQTQHDSGQRRLAESVLVRTTPPVLMRLADGLYRRADLVLSVSLRPSACHELVAGIRLKED